MICSIISGDAIVYPEAGYKIRRRKCRDAFPSNGSGQLGAHDRSTRGSFGGIEGPQREENSKIFVALNLREVCIIFLLDVVHFCFLLVFI